MIRLAGMRIRQHQTNKGTFTLYVYDGVPELSYTHGHPPQTKTIRTFASVEEAEEFFAEAMKAWEEIQINL